VQAGHAFSSSDAQPPRHGIVFVTSDAFGCSERRYLQGNLGVGTPKAGPGIYRPIFKAIISVAWNFSRDRDDMGPYMVPAPLDMTPMDHLYRWMTISEVVHGKAWTGDGQARAWVCSVGPDVLSITHQLKASCKVLYAVFSPIIFEAIAAVAQDMLRIAAGPLFDTWGLSHLYRMISKDLPRGERECWTHRPILSMKAVKGLLSIQTNTQLQVKLPAFMMSKDLTNGLCLYNPVYYA